MHSALSFSHVSFAWPDGGEVFADLTFAAPPGLSGIVGRNGIGKSTLLRLASGALAPTAGGVARPPALGYVPQRPEADAAATVAEVLGIGPVVAALQAIEAGSTDQAHYDAVGDDWAVEERAHATLASLGLERLELHRPVGRTSGGEATLLAVGAGLLAAPDVLLLDEPTNNLDAHARDRLAEALAARDEPTVVVTHDRALLERVDQIGELRERPDRTTELRWFGGALTEFEQALAGERAAAEQAVTAAASDVAREHRDLRSRVDSGGKRDRQAAKALANNKVPRIAVKAKKDQAAATDARVMRVHEARVAAARERLEAAEAAIPRDRSIRVDLPGTHVPPRRRVLEAEALTIRTGAVLDAVVQGPERIVLAGRNGSGKTTLARTLLGRLEPESGAARLHVPAGYLPQRLDNLDDTLSVVDNVRAGAPQAPPQEVRDQLGRFQFRGSAADAATGTLSGGERFRAALAAVLLARPEPQLLVLDEPTNNLDFESQAQLVQALEGYEGALLVISHDPAFVDAIGPTRTWWCEPGRPIADEER